MEVPTHQVFEFQLNVAQRNRTQHIGIALKQGDLQFIFSGPGPMRRIESKDEPVCRTGSVCVVRSCDTSD